MSEEKEEKQKFKINSITLDTSEYKHLIIFPDGMRAVLQKTVVDLGSEYLFFVVPTKSMMVMLNIEENPSKWARHNQVEDNYEIRIDKNNIFPMNFHPMFQTWFCLRNWWGEYVNPFEERYQQLEKKLKTVTKERDAAYRQNESLVRQLNKNAKQPWSTIDLTTKQAGKALQNVNLIGMLGNTNDMKGSDDN